MAGPRLRLGERQRLGGRQGNQKGTEVEREGTEGKMESKHVFKRRWRGQTLGVWGMGTRGFLSAPGGHPSPEVMIE